MKNFITLVFICFLAFPMQASLPISLLNPFENEATIPSTDFNAYDGIIVQNISGIAERSFDKDYQKGFDLYQTNSYRYNTSITSGRYSTFISEDFAINGKANHIKIENSRNKITENWRYDTRIMYLSRITASGKIIQRNYHSPTTSNYGATGNDNHFKATPYHYTNNTRHRISSCADRRWINYQALIASQKKLTTLKTNSKYHG